MKNSISHILSFITTLLLTILIFFVFIELNLRNSILIKSLNNINYYEEAYNTIISKVDDFIINEEVKEKFKESISKDIIKNDINNIIIKKQYDISHYDEFYNIISEYSTDIEICEKYASEINKIYKSNIFPINEYKMLSKFYIKTTDFIIYSLMISGIIVLFEFITFIINKNLKYSKISVLASSIIMILPFIFVRTTNIFNNFIYTNNYYTNFLIKILNNIKNSLFIVGLIIIIVIFLNELHKNRK